MARLQEMAEAAMNGMLDDAVDNGSDYVDLLEMLSALGVAVSHVFGMLPEEGRGRALEDFTRTLAAAVACVDADRETQQ